MIDRPGASIADLAALSIGFVVHRELDLMVLHTAIIEGGIQSALVLLLVTYLPVNDVGLVNFFYH